MPKKKPIVAIMYDFDGTLASGNMQEYDFIPQLGMKSEKFWSECSVLSKENEMDGILAYMYNMIDKAKANHLQIKRQNFIDYGKGVRLYEGVEEWFSRINNYGKQKGVRIEHYIISSGIKEMIEGTKIAAEFKKIFASYFYYDQHGVASWPAVALNYTTKTQFLFRINKGCLDIADDKSINKYMEEETRPVKFQNMIYIGDGDTDIPCMKLVKNNGGHSIAVYRPNTKKNRVNKLISENRVNFVAPANYCEDKEIDIIVKTIIDEISAQEKLNEFTKIAKSKMDNNGDVNNNK